MRSAKFEVMNRGSAIFALFIAGLGWGTTGLFVRALGNLGLSVYELLIVRLLVTGAVITPIFFYSVAHARRRLALRPTLGVGLAMVFYYLGAITAFHNLQLVVAALIIGSSPLIAWTLPLLIECRRPTDLEIRQGVGVAVAIAGLLLLGFEYKSRPSPGLTHETRPWLGLAGAVTSALITVFNARYLKKHGEHAPKPLEITLATVILGIALSPLILDDVTGDFYKIFWVARDHIWFSLGFGVLATAIPGLAITYASVRLEPQATATVSIQLQVWSGVLAWILLGEAMTSLQIVASLLVIIGSWLCIRKQRRHV